MSVLRGLRYVRLDKVSLLIIAIVNLVALPLRLKNITKVTQIINTSTRKNIVGPTNMRDQYMRRRRRQRLWFSNITFYAETRSALFPFREITHSRRSRRGKCDFRENYWCPQLGGVERLGSINFPRATCESIKIISSFHGAKRNCILCGTKISLHVASEHSEKLAHSAKLYDAESGFSLALARHH